ncbi:unnamed protein product [Schistocephalus solidus]|uniref:Uncharacterized protein n=1 Tax=Schistocephalus solidus TaxID=70667 RepID=A0A183TEE8_SCHSO|nr:unnamed protein product [Schistocephalus solidus]
MSYLKAYELPKSNLLTPEFISSISNLAVSANSLLCNAPSRSTDIDCASESSLERDIDPNSHMVQRQGFHIRRKGKRRLLSDFTDRDSHEGDEEEESMRIDGIGYRNGDFFSTEANRNSCSILDDLGKFEEARTSVSNCDSLAMMRRIRHNSAPPRSSILSEGFDKTIRPRRFTAQALQHLLPSQIRHTQQHQQPTSASQHSMNQPLLESQQNAQSQPKFEK